jgi:hypothetical protein
MRIDRRWLVAVSAAALLFTGCDSGSGSGSGNKGNDTAAGTDTDQGTDTNGALDQDTANLDPDMANLDGGPVDPNQDGGNVDPTGDVGPVDPTEDAAIQPPDEDAGSDPVMEGPCDMTGFTAMNEIAVINQEAGSPTKYLIYQAHSSTEAPLDVISVEINAAMAPAPGSTVELTGLASADLAQGVPVIVAMGVGCTEGCPKWLFADEGTITFHDLSETGKITATLSHVRFREIQINQDTGQVAKVANGTTWCLPKWEIDMPFQQPAEMPTGGPAQPTCVAEGTGVYQGDNIANLTLTNCLGETEQLHSNCGQSKAHWLLSTAGWCSACAELLGALSKPVSAGGMGGAGGTLSRASVAAANPGLDIWIVLGEDQNSQKPTQSYCMAYAAQNKVDPAMVFIDWTDAETQVPLVDPTGYAIPVQALGNVYSVMNPYLVATADGAVEMAWPWSGVLRGSNMEYVWSSYLPGEINSVLGNLLSQ